MVTSSTIASFDVKLTSEGLLVIETKLAKGMDFIEVMDKWKIGRASCRERV